MTFTENPGHKGSIPFTTTYPVTNYRHLELPQVAFLGFNTDKIPLLLNIKKAPASALQSQ